MELNNLIDAIIIQENLLNELLTVLEHETTQLSDVDTAAMAMSDRAKEDLIAKIAQSSKVLQKSLAAMADREGLQANSSLGVIARQMAARGNRELLGRQEKLVSAVARVQDRSSLNREIAECFANSIASSLSLITRMINQSNFYGASGSYQRRPASAMLVNREA